MQHAGLQYGQGAVNAQSPAFADISGGNTTSSLRQFRKKDGTEKGSGTDLNVDSSHIARVPPHNHYPARPNDYFRYQHQYPDYNSPFKETPAQVKYSEIAETPPQPPLHHVEHPKHKDVHKEFMDMCNISSQPHMKQNYADNLNRQQSYAPSDAASVHHQYLHKEPQVHPGYKPESQYQQYPQLAKYNMPSQCRKYAPPPESDFLAKLQRINPSMARSIMSDHHIRESQTACPPPDQNRLYPQNQRYYPPIQNSFSYPPNYQPYNYSSSCNYKHPDYTRANQMPVGGAQYPAINPHSERSMSPRNLHMMNYGTSPQKISPTYPQYNAPEYAQHYQHRRTSMQQEYYQQACRSNPYMGAHQVSPDPPDNRASGGGLRHFIENWAEEEAANEVTPIFKENIRIHNESSNEQVFVINSSDIPQCLDVSLVTTENGQYIIKSGPIDSSVVRIREATENNGERTVNLQIVEGAPKSDCMLEDKAPEATTVPYVENQPTKDCDEETKTSQPADEPVQTPQGGDDVVAETSVIVNNEFSVIKDMPIIEEHAKSVLPLEELEKIAEALPVEEPTHVDEEKTKDEDTKQLLEETQITTTTKRTQRIFSVDDIIGTSTNHSRRSSLQLPLKLDDDKVEEAAHKEENEDGETSMEFRSAISIEDDSVILEIGGALVQLNVNWLNGTKVLTVLSLSDELVIDVNGNYQACEDQEKRSGETVGHEEVFEEAMEEKLPVEIGPETEEKSGGENDDDIHEGKEEIIDGEKEEKVDEEKEELKDEDPEQIPQEIEDEMIEDVCQSEVVIGEENVDDMFLDLNFEEETLVETKEFVEESVQCEENPKSGTNTTENEERVKVKKSCDSKAKKVSANEEIKEEHFVEEKKTMSKDPKELVPKEDDKHSEKKLRQFSKEEDGKIKEENRKSRKNEKKSEGVDKANEVKCVLKQEVNEEIKHIPEEEKKLIVEDVKKVQETSKEKKVEEKPVTKAAKKLYVVEPMKKSPKETKKTDEKTKHKVDVKRSMSKLEEAVNKIKSLKEKSARADCKTKKEEKKSPKNVKKVTFNLETEVREINKEEMDRKKLSWEEYNHRKRRISSVSSDSEDTKSMKIMEDTVTSTDDINDEVVARVAESIENAIKDSRRSPPKTPSNWEADTPSPSSPKNDPLSSRKCLIDINEFNIKPIESVSTPSPVSSSQFSYHSEDDSLQVYKDVVDSKLNSLNLKIPKFCKPKPVDKFSVLLDRFLNKATLNCGELEKVKKIIEFKRKIEEKQLTYEVKGERDYKDLKLHFRKVPEKRKKKRFRNLYDTSDDSDESGEKVVGDYSVYQRESQGLPKLIFKRKSGLPQPFVKLERSQAVDLLAKKRKLY